jgi:hypothetical protein
VGIRQERVRDSATSTCAKAFITYIRVTVQALYVLAGDVFGTGILH